MNFADFNWDSDTSLSVELALQSRSDATARAYRQRWAKIEAWLDGRELTDRLLAQFLHGLYQKGLSPATVKQHLLAANFYMKHMDKPKPAGRFTKQVYEMVCRKGSDRGRGSAPGLKPDQFNAMLSACDDGTLPGYRDAALFRCIWDAALRVSEAANLMVEDINEKKDGDATILVRQSKTDQSGEGAYGYIGFPTVSAIKRWIHFANITSEPIFRPIRNGVQILNKPIDRRSIAYAVRKRAKQAKVGKVTTHSFRRGQVENLTLKGASTHRIQAVGRWKSPIMVAKYAEGVEAERNAVADLVYGKGKKTRRGFRVINGAA